MTRIQWPLFHPMASGKAFCVMGSHPGRGSGGEGKTARRRDVLGEAWREGSGRVVMHNCG